MPRHWLIFFGSLVCFWLDLLPFRLCQPVLAQFAKPDNWEVGFIHVREEDHGKQIPTDYWPIEISELESRLDQVRQQRIQRQLHPGILEEAIYVAYLQTDGLLSDQSRWRVRGDESLRPVLVGKLSCALTEARNLPEGQKQLSADLRFLPDGSIELLPDSKTMDRWFGFQCVPSENTSAKQFQMELPPALLGRMLIAADASLTLKSTQVVVQPVDSAQDVLPVDWGELVLPGPAVLERAASSNGISKTGGNMRWWMVNLSGVSRFALDVEVATESDNADLHHAVLSTELKYTCTDSQTTVTAGMLLSGSSRQPLQFRMGPSVRLAAINVDSQPVEWTTVATLPDATIIQIEDSVLKPMSRIELTATAAVIPPRPQQLEPGMGTEVPHASGSAELEGEAIPRTETTASASLETFGSIVSLPEIKLNNSYTLQGTTTVVGDEGWQVDKVIAEGGFVPLRLPASENATVSPEAYSPSEPVSFAWQSRWIGHPPQAEAWLTISRSNWNSEGLTRLTVRQSSISATVNILFEGRTLNSNYLELPISEEWVIDKAQLVEDSDGRFQLRLVEDNKGTRRIVVRWEQLESNVRVKLEILAHLPVSSANETLLLNESRLLQAPAGNHQMNYAIQEHGGYQMRFTPRLVQMTVPRQELSEWLQELLPETDLIAIRDYSDGRNLFQFDSSTGSFTANSLTVLRRQGERAWRSTTQINITVIAGSIDRIPVWLRDQDPSHWSFELLNGDGTATALQPANVRAINGSEKVECDLLLPVSSSDPLTLRVSSEFAWDPNEADQSLRIITPGLPTATKIDSLLFLPDSFEVGNSELPLELLPAGACCQPPFEGSLEGLLEDEPLSRFLVARVNGQDSQELLTRQNSITAPDGTVPAGHSQDAWIWAETIQHRMDDSGSITHELALDVQSQRSDLLSLRFPMDWNLSHLSVQGKQSQDYHWQQGVLQVPLNIGERLSISVRLVTKRSPLGWFARVNLEVPQYDVPVLQRGQSVWLSPKSLLVSEIFNWHWGATNESLTDNSSSNQQRVLPGTHWWRWLYPRSTLGTGNSGWTNHPIEWQASSGSTKLVLRVLDRNAATTLLWATIAVLGSLSWILLRNSFKIWWLVVLAFMGLSLIVADRLLVVSQLLLMAMILGGICRVIERIVSSRAIDSSKETRSRSGIVTVLVLFALLLCPAMKAHSQEVPPSESKEEMAIYGVYIPSDAENLPVGEFAYIPKQLRDLLYETNSSRDKQGAGSILSANYTIKLKQDERDLDLVQGCTIDLRIVVYQADTEILIPIKGTGLTWIGTPLLNGQSRIWGGRNFVVAPDGSGVIFRADTTGVMNLSLQFKPMVAESTDRRYSIQATIPPVANAKIRVTTSGLINNLYVNARGVVQRTFLGDTLGNLGPIDQLNLAWSLSQKPANLAPAEQTSESWVYARASHLVAACQLTVQRSQVLSRELDLVVSGDWHPVGESWGDADRVSTSVSSTFRGRTVYRIRLRETTGEDCRIRVLLIPKSQADSNGIDVPFISLDRVHSKSTIFWWSSEKDAEWIPEIPESRPVQTGIETDWEAFGLAPRRVGYQIFGTGVRLRPQHASPPNNPISEVHSLRLGSNRTFLSYTANWMPSGNQPDSLLVEVPKGLTAPELELNGVPARYEMDASYRMLLISMKDNGISRLGRLKLEIELPLLAGKLETVPCVQILQGTPSQSYYEIFQGANIEVSIPSNQEGLVLQPNTAVPAPGEVLENLERKIGQFDLSLFPARNRSIPLVMETRPTTNVDPRSAVMVVEESKEGWKATVRCQWHAESSTPDFAFLDLPFGVRDGLTAGALAFKFMPHSDPDRTTLCIPVPNDGISSPGVEFSFWLNQNTNSHTVPIPLIRLVGSNQSFVTALPRTVDSVPVRWLSTGQLLAHAWHEQSGVPPLDGFDFYSGGAELNSVTWLPLNQIPRASSLILSVLEILSSDTNSLAGTIQYWLEPRSQVTQRFSVPQDCHVLGVECNGARAHWVRSGDELRVTLQPNTMPVHVRVMAQWNLRNKSSLQIPKAICNGQPGPILITNTSGSYWTPFGTGVSRLDNEGSILTDHWARVVATSIPKLINLPAIESTNWLSQWRPDSLGLSQDWVVSDSEVQTILGSSASPGSGDLTVGKLWSQTELLTESTGVGSHPVAERIQQPSQRESWSLGSLELPLRSAGNTSIRVVNVSSSRAIGLVVLAVLAIGPWLIEKRLPRLHSSLWMDWLLLAALVWIVDPFFWISLTFALVGLTLKILQVIEKRRRSEQFFG